MSLLKCLICCGELEILGSAGFMKKVRCCSCGYTNLPAVKKEPEVVVYKRKGY